MTITKHKNEANNNIKTKSKFCNNLTTEELIVFTF